MILDERIIRQIQKELKWFAFPDEHNDISNSRLCMFLNGIKCVLFETGISFEIAAQTNCEVGVWKFCVEVYQYDNYADCWSEKKLIMTIFEHRVEYHAENKGAENKNE